MVITETERFGPNGVDKMDFRILQAPTGNTFLNFISSNVRVFLPYVGIVKAGKDGKIVVVKQIP